MKPVSQLPKRSHQQFPLGDWLAGMHPLLGRLNTFVGSFGWLIWLGGVAEEGIWMRRRKANGEVKPNGKT